MSIGNTYPTVSDEIHIESDNGDVFLLDLIPRIPYIDSTEIKELMLRLKDDTKLREFFIGYSGEDDKNSEMKQLLSFVANSKVLPYSNCRINNKPLYSYFSKLSTNANSLFISKLNRDIYNVCERAVQIGIIEIDSHLCTINYHDQLVEVIVPDEMYKTIPKTHQIEVMMCFYRLSDNFYELWIKKEKKGLFLEIWLYHALKHYFVNTDIGIYHSVNVRKGKDIADSIYELIGTESINSSFHVTEIDILVTYKGKPYCIIECKNEKSIMPDVIKLKGLMSLLQVEKGILFTKEFIYDCKQPELFKGLFVQANSINSSHSIENVISIIENI